MAIRRSASRSFVAPARSRSVIEPSSRVSAPISSARSLSKLTSSRSMSICAVLWASAVSGRLIRSDSQPPSSRAIAPARSTAARNATSTPRRSAVREPREWLTTMRAGRSTPPESLSKTKGNENPLTRAADAASDTLSAGRRTATASSESGVSPAR